MISFQNKSTIEDHLIAANVVISSVMSAEIYIKKIYQKIHKSYKLQLFEP